MPKFNLSDHVADVYKLAEANKVSVEEALYQFLTNLAVMKEQFKGTPELNYHQLGQAWNKLLSKEKVAQKAEMQALLKRGTKVRAYDRAGN